MDLGISLRPAQGFLNSLLKQLYSLAMAAGRHEPFRPFQTKLKVFDLCELAGD